MKKICFMSIFFALAVTVLTLKVRIGNPVLRWCGDHLFPIYIYRRLPMVVLASLLGTMLSKRWAVVFFVGVTFILSFLIASQYKRIEIKCKGNG